MAMRWFGGQKPREVWDEDIQWPIGDIEAAHRIRDICRSAAGSAGNVAGSAGGPDNNKYHAERYERAAKTAMEIAMKIADDLLRDSAVRQIIGLNADPLFTRVYKWRSAMAQYSVGHLERLKRIQSLSEKLPGLALAGNGFNGIGVPDCVRSGTEAATKILSEMGLWSSA